LVENLDDRPKTTVSVGHSIVEEGGESERGEDQGTGRQKKKGEDQSWRFLRMSMKAMNRISTWDKQFFDRKCEMFGG
jgi:hypothetical protein